MWSTAKRLRFLFPAGTLPFFAALALAAEDCNKNGIDDDQDIAARTSQDCNGNEIPDECDLAFTHLKFQAPQRVRALTPPREFFRDGVTGDFNGDGHLDLAYDVGALENFGNRASIIFGRGDGTFAQPKTIMQLRSLGGLAAADLNGDGKLDLALGRIDAGSFLDVVLGNGDGTFGKPRVTGMRGNAGKVVAADFDGDGDVDLVVYSPYNDGIILFKNSGLGVFKATTVRPWTPDHREMFLVAGDFDEDRDVDLLIHDGPTDVGFILLRNQGDGTFDEWPGRDEATMYGEPFAGDFDGDGDLDLIVAAGDLLPNRGNGTFDLPRPSGLAVRPRFTAYGAVAADIDRDRSLDLILPASNTVPYSNQQAIALARNREDGTFRPLEKIPIGSFAEPVLVADMNHDGAPDIVATDSSSGSFLILLGLAETGPASRDVNGNRIPDECETDCDRDGLPDAHAIATGKARDCNRNGIPDPCDLQAGVRFEQGECIALGGAFFRSVAVADLNGDDARDLAFLRDLGFDANPDPLVFESATRLEVYLNLGDGGFVPGQVLDFEAPLGSIAAGDFDGDGSPDLFGTQGIRDSVFVLRNDGGGAFELMGELAAEVQYPYKVRSLDLNGDDRLDLLVECGANTDFTASVLISEAPAAFSLARSFRTGGRIAAIADLDQSGAPDLITDYPTGSVSAAWNDGTGAFGGQRALAAGSLLASVDADGDGDVDLAIDDRGAAEWYVLLNRGDRTFERGAAIPRGLPVGGFVALDADGDGDSDLVGATGDRRLAVLPGDGRGGFASAFLTEGPFPFATQLFPGDFDRDGRTDLAVMARDCPLSVFFNRTPAPASEDADRDGIPDDCAGAAGGQVPSDGNQDGKLDIADAVSLLGRLFLGIASPWPCDGGGPDPGATDLRLLDANGDGALDIADPIHVLYYLFFPESPAPALGTRCTALAGCPDRCIP